MQTLPGSGRHLCESCRQGSHFPCTAHFRTIQWAWMALKMVIVCQNVSYRMHHAIFTPAIALRHCLWGQIREMAADRNHYSALPMSTLDVTLSTSAINMPADGETCASTNVQTWRLGALFAMLVCVNHPQAATCTKHASVWLSGS